MRKGKPLKLWDIPVLDEPPPGYVDYEYFTSEEQLENIIRTYSGRYARVKFAIYGTRGGRKLYVINDS